MSSPRWTPSAERVAASRIDAFRRAVALRHHVDLPDTRALHAWSVDHLDELWSLLWERSTVVGVAATRRSTRATAP